ncbi:NAD-dependent succinate-semialdehyde dehydrogenase [Allopusillimonas ginsengisoli]|uniref:NAD-dependent succinate-semialdehyde dehydrogenase n=1 Tax=Allopusillimonas ginsengisoli TaxID=453575 RepID=UPI0010C1C27F|nr:NAD-dependent succinate-semialdehyde dehydrogenase [Allopusillimonas ginsengisoli]
MSQAIADANTLSDYHDLANQLFINGKWVPASTGNVINVYNPSDESLICSVADATVEDGISAIDAADDAAAGWAATAPRKRAEILMRAFNIMVERSEWLAGLISLENGKSLSDARGEVAYAAEFFRWYAEEGVRLNGSIGVSPSGANRIVVQYQPVGIAVLVTPWNFPAAMATRKIGPALAAGCTCVLKPATETPLTAYAVAEILHEAGVPDGVVNVLTTSTSGKMVSAMLHDPRVRKLSFTGSTEVGRILLKQAADQVINCSMELGGNAPFIVFDDADLDSAVEGAMVAKMRNGGEACTAANRFYVQRGVLEAFTQKLAEEMDAVKMGRATDQDTGLGPLVNASSRDKVASLVEDAIARGARLVIGGKAVEGKGFYYPATVLADVSADSALLHEEIFGPVAPIVAFDTEEQAIKLANDTEYGLVSYVYTADLARGMRVSERMSSGMVALNRGLVSDAAAPFGGAKQSGLGREGGLEGLLAYTEAKYIATSW